MKKIITVIIILSAIVASGCSATNKTSLGAFDNDYEFAVGVGIVLEEK
jgi:uncharacterized protein YxeA